RSAPQHRAGAPDSLQAIAELFRFAGGLCRQAHAIERAGASARQNGAEDERGHVSDNAIIIVLRAGEGAERGAFGEAGGDLHAPRREQAGNGGRGLRTMRDAEISDRRQAGLIGVGRSRRRRVRAAPFLDVVAGDRKDVVLRLERQNALAREPVGERVRPGVIGGRRQAEIAEAMGELGQKLRRRRDRGRRIERVGEPAVGGGARHELRDPLRARRTDCAGVEGALAPNEPGEEIDRQPLLPGRSLDDPAERRQRVVGRGRGLIRQRRRRRGRQCGDEKGADAPGPPRADSAGCRSSQSRNPSARRPRAAALEQRAAAASGFEVFQPDTPASLQTERDSPHQRLKLDSGYSALNLASTPLVHPNPTCNGYSPPPPPLPSAPCSTLYFSTSTPVAAYPKTFVLIQRSAILRARSGSP